MSQLVKKRNVKNEKVTDGADSNTSSSSSSSDEEDEYVGDEQIQVDFEGRCPVDSDFHGIKLLLHQLFLKSNVDTSALADLIISQNYVGSVVKQCDDEPESDEEDNMDTDDVFGVTTVINLSQTNKKECTSQICAMLKDLCSKHGDDRTVSRINQLLSDESSSVGLLINERFINIPPQICVPLLVNLREEMEKASQKKMPFNFQYFILICKLYKSDQQKENQKKKKNSRKKKHKNFVPDPAIIWSNSEEEVLQELAECSFEFRVKEDSDSAVGGNWRESDAEMLPWRKVLVFPAAKLEEAISRVSSMLQQ